jgi:hypothetical protein
MRGKMQKKAPKPTIRFAYATSPSPTEATPPDG